MQVKMCDIEIRCSRCSDKIVVNAVDNCYKNTIAASTAKDLGWRKPKGQDKMCPLCHKKYLVEVKVREIEDAKMKVLQLQEELTVLKETVRKDDEKIRISENFMMRRKDLLKKL